MEGPRCGERSSSTGSRVPLGYTKDPAKTSETFPTVDGTRFALAGDRAIVEADGTLRLLGRDSATINTGGGLFVLRAPDAVESSRLDLLSVLHHLVPRTDLPN